MGSVNPNVQIQKTKEEEDGTLDAGRDEKACAHDLGIVSPHERGEGSLNEESGPGEGGRELVKVEREGVSSREKERKGM